MFASIGYCCSGVDSTYQTVVGRSRSLFGPYVNKEGEDMMNNKYTLIITSNDRFVGNGHNSQIVQDNDGNDWIFYHGVDRNNPKGRQLMMDRVRWDAQNWPYIQGGTPSITAENPVF
jgi:arabinan endo-1,5-alpha-L-arabinosidase